MAAVFEVQPEEVHFRIERLDVQLAVAYFDYQQSLFGQVVGRFGQHPPHQVQAIVAARQAQLGLVKEFGRHVGEVLGIHIGRVGDDQVEALAGQAVETVTLHGVDAVFQAVALDVQVGYFQGVEGQVAEHHLGVREGVGAGDTDATGAGAEVEHPRRFMG
ncbi:hypothetical protein FQZ97_957150 [compost metagenome]